MINNSIINRIIIYKLYFILLLLFNVKVVDKYFFYYSHIMILCYLFIIYCKYILRSNAANIYFIMVVTFLMLNLLSAYTNGIGERHYNELFKIVVYLFGCYVLVNELNSFELYKIVKIYAYLFLFYLLFVLYTSSSNLFSYAGRLYLEETGSPNALGSVIGIFIIILIDELNKKFNIAKFIIFISYMIFIILGCSRSVLVALIISLLIIKTKLKFILYFIIAGIIGVIILSNFIDIESFIQKANVVNRVMGSDIEKDPEIGRLNIWKKTINDFISTPSAWVFGFGVGKVILYKNYIAYERTIYHSHNTYLYSLYSFGIVGLVGFCTILYLIYMRIRRSSFFKLKMTIFAYYLINFLFDVHIVSTQIVIPHLIAISFLASKDEVVNKLKTDMFRFRY
jgi:O-antigen ligase